MASKPQPRYQPGDRIGGRYQVHKALLGGMGEVYLCLDLEEMQPLALKTFQQRYLTDAQRLRRAFETEVATWVAMEKHPNIVRCFWMQILDNQPFMALEWIAGEEGLGTDLRGWLQRGPLDLKLALEIAIDICHGLIHAQQKQPGLVHRDLKPENILMAQGKLAKITDFGLVQIVAKSGLEVDQGRATINNRQSFVGGKGIAGTPAYMAPEQWRGARLDERTDIYALGIILHEMLTGASPFTIDFTPTTLQQWRVLHESAPCAQLPPSFTSELKKLVAACLAKALTDRPTSLLELLTRLSELYEHLFDQLSPAPSDQGTLIASDYSNRGITYHTLGQNALALNDFSRALALEPNLVQIYSNRGATYADLHQYEQALADFERAIALDPNHVQAYVGRAATHTTLHQYEQALADCERALELNSNLAIVYSNRGNIYADLHQYEQALADFERAIALDPNDTRAYFNRGVTYIDLHQYGQALADFEQTIALNPNDAQAYFNHGIVLEVLQEHEQALADYEQAIALDPNYTQVYSRRGNIYANFQEYELALADYDRVIELNPNDAQAYFCRGAIYHAFQEYEQALANYDQVITLNPNDAQAYSNRGSILTDLQRYEQAWMDFERALALEPGLAQIYYNRGNLYVALQKYEAALADYNQTIVLDPKAAIAYSNRGATYAILQDFERALADYRQAIELDPNHVSAYLNIGVLWRSQGRHKDALPYFEKAAQLGNPQAAQFAAQARQLLGIKLAPQIDQAQLAIASFQQAKSVEAMRQAVAHFPFMVQARFVEAVEQIVAQQMPEEYQSHFKQCLAWLRQIVREQNQ